MLAGVILNLAIEEVDETAGRLKRLIIVANVHRLVGQIEEQRLRFVVSLK